MPASGALLSIPRLADAAAAGNAATAGNAPAGKVTGKASAGTSGTGKLPGYAEHFLTSDMDGLGPDGKPTGQIATFTGASRKNSRAEEAMRRKMQLTKEEQVHPCGAT